jgi:hypothetical protein
LFPSSLEALALFWSSECWGWKAPLWSGTCGIQKQMPGKLFVTTLALFRICLVHNVLPLEMFWVLLLI